MSDEDAGNEDDEGDSAISRGNHLMRGRFWGGLSDNTATSFCFFYFILRIFCFDIAFWRVQFGRCGVVV